MGLGTGAQMRTSERVIFAAGDIFGGGGSALISVLYLFYLTDIIGIPPASAGLALLIPKVWDAINDPLMGALSDNTRTRWGRRRPFIALGGSLLVLAIAAIWAPIGGWDSTTAKTIWAIGANLVYTTVATMVAVPYGSLSTEVTTDYEERNRINVMRLAFSTIAAAVCTLGGTTLLNWYTSGRVDSLQLYLLIVGVFGVVFVTPILLVAIRTRERAPIPTERTRLSMAGVLAPLKYASFRKLLGMYVCQAITMDIVSALVVYYSLYVVRLNVTVFLGIFIVVNLVGFVVVGRLVQFVSKNLIYRAGIPVALIGALGIGLYPREWPAWGSYLCAMLVAAGICGGVLMSWVMFPDVIDDAELVTGERNAGSFSGLMTLIRGVATAIALQLIGLMLQFTGYRAPEHYVEPTQPLAVQIGIRATMAGAVIVLMSVGWLIARTYPLTRPVCEQMQVQLAEQRRAASAAAMLDSAGGARGGTDVDG